MPPTAKSGLPDAEIASQPNKYAPASGFSLQDGVIRMDGYQAFEYNPETGDITPRTKGLRAKAGLMSKYFTPSYLHGRTFLDLGGNNGYYSLKALSCGAASATVVDMDTAPIENLHRLNKEFPQLPIKGISGNVMECREPADVVIALALIHWIYNLTTGLGSLERAIGFLAGLSREALIIEWVDPLDAVILEHHHVNVASESGQNQYTREEFLRQLRAQFDVVRSIGKVSDTREVFLAARHSFLNIDLRWQQPVIEFPGHQHVSTREITPGVWSRLYLGDETYLKQASSAVGRNELGILAGLQHPALPSVEFCREEPESILFFVRRLPGRSLEELSGAEPLPLDFVEAIARQLSAVLAYLEQAGVEHRDLQPGNVIYDSVSQTLGLIDFGWAAGPGGATLTLPETLGFRPDFQGRLQGQPPQDLFALGSLICWLLRGRAHPLSQVALWCLSGQANVHQVAEVCRESPETMSVALHSNPQAQQAVLQELGRTHAATAHRAQTHTNRHTWLPAGDLDLCGNAILKIERQSHELHQKISKLEAEKTSLKNKLQKLKGKAPSGANEPKKPSFFQRLFGKP